MLITLYAAVRHLPCITSQGHSQSDPKYDHHKSKVERRDLSRAVYRVPGI